LRAARRTAALNATPAGDHALERQLGLRDLVLAQVLTVVGSSWVGIAAGVGRAQLSVWLVAFTMFYAPMAVTVFYLNRDMPLEGGLYSWARRSFGDTAGFMTAWNIWAYALCSIATILFQIPSEMAFMLGPQAAALPENHGFVYALLVIVIGLLMGTAIQGLGLGKWIHNLGGAGIMAAFGLLIVSPLIAWAGGAHLHYAPLDLHLPPTDLRSLSLMGQVLFASSGLEYIAIMAGETRVSGSIGRSVVLATPIIFGMFVLGTAAVVAFHDLHAAIPINYVAPIPQTLTLAFGEGGAGALLAKCAILLLQIRILSAASLLFAGATRLPMTAGWDHLIPAWFTRLHPRHRTPVNSIFVTGAAIAALLVLSSAGVRAVEAFSVLNDASSEFYALAYLAMFLIPLCGERRVRDRLPRWVRGSCLAGLVAILFVLTLNAYPFVDVARPGLFAVKILGTVFCVNALGYGFYRLRQTRSGQLQPRRDRSTENV
jgi:amino acid transporter